MVAKISLGNSLYRALVYNSEKINKEDGRLLVTNKIYNDGTGKVNINRAYQDFRSWMPTSTRTERPMVHISLNPHPDDRLSDVEYAELAREYMEKMGFGDMPYMVYKHMDIDRHHLHIVALRVDTDGRCISDKNNFYRSKDICRELEKKYNLRSSERQKITPDMPIRKIDPSGDIKRQLANAVKMVGMRYRFQTYGEYNAVLSLFNIRCEPTDGKVNGREYHGLVYFATDDERKTIATPFKSSRLGKFAGRDAIEQRFERNKDKIEPMKTKAVIAPILAVCNDKEVFIAKLKEAKIDVLFRYTTEGRIYGVTFIDHNNMAVLNGSRIGREFSANALEEKFNGDQRQRTVEPDTQQPIIPVQNTSTSDESQSTTAGADTHTQPPNQSQHRSTQSAIRSNDSDNAPTLPGLDLFQTGSGFNAEEEAFYREMQRRKKKRRRGPKL